MNTKQLVVGYVILVILVAGYFVFLEDITGGNFVVDIGGRDLKVSFFDVALVLVFIVASALTLIATMAYDKKRSQRLFLVAGAFFLFALKSAVGIVYNHVIGEYGYLGIGVQTLELLILLLLFFALFRK